MNGVKGGVGGGGERYRLSRLWATVCFLCLYTFFIFFIFFVFCLFYHIFNGGYAGACRLLWSSYVLQNSQGGMSVSSA